MENSELDYDYSNPNTDVKTFQQLSQQVQDDLTAWYNVCEPDTTDKQRLFRLYMQGEFEAWDCPECGERVYRGNPESYDNFQGVRNQDFSFFGNSDKYTADYIESMCDNCRCYK